MSDDYLCLTVRSHPGESETAFKSRLSQFWTHMLRQFPDDFEKVYAETSAFDSEGDRVTRQYLVEISGIDVVEREMAAHKVDHEPIDRDDHYSKFEATPPEWMWIEH
jgi:hypothetical protein